MNAVLRLKNVWMLSLPLAAAAQAPPNPQLSAAEVIQLCQRASQLMDAGGVAIPDLQRAAGPVRDNALAACSQIQLQAGAGQATYTLLVNLRAYLSLADAVPKPYPFPDTAARQFTELRDTTNRLEAHFRALLDSKDLQLRSPDRDNLTRYAEANRKVLPAQRGNHRVVFLGDSITDIWRLNEYFPGKDYINRGIGGQITGEMLGRMKSDVLDLHPDAVLILGGTNDLARNVPLVAIEDHYAMLATLAHANNIKVIFASVLPVSDYHKDSNPAYEMTRLRPPVYIKALNDWLERYCAQRGFTYLNYYQALVDPSGQMMEDAADDGLHPNSKGFRIMAPLAQAAIDKLFQIVPVQAPAPAPVAPPPQKSLGGIFTRKPNPPKEASK
jgi:lysophospholipase L1-like esterase